MDLPAPKPTNQAPKQPILEQDFDFPFKSGLEKDPEKTFCEICCHTQDKSFEFAAEESLRMLICYGCGSSTHLYCYGPNTPYNVEKSTDTSKEAFMFVCARCREKGPDFKPACILCCNQIGLLKHFTLGGQTQTDWIHPLCALFSPAFDLVDTDEMTFELYSSKNLGRRAAKKQACELCHGSMGTLFPCSHPECKKSIHIFCGLLEKAQNVVFANEDNIEENPSEWNIKLFLEKNPNYKNYPLKSNPFSKEELEGIYREFKATERKIQKGQETSEPPAGPKKKEKSKKKQLISEDKLAKEKEETLELSEAFQAFVQAFEEKIKQESNQTMQTRKKEAESMATEEGGPDSQSTARGSRVMLQCVEHKTLETYCVCEPMNMENPSMIACDYCDNWFHFGCVGLGNKSKEAACKEIPYYLCQKCKELIKFKGKLLKFDRKLAQNSEPNLSIEEVSQFELFPKDPNVSRFRLADFILVYRIVLRKIQRVGRNPPESGIDGFLRATLETLALIPFKIPRRFDELKKAKHMAFCLNFLLENDAKRFLNDLKVESCVSPSGEFQQENFDRNMEHKQKVANLEEFFRRKGLDLKPRLMLNSHKSLLILDWIIEYHETFSLRPSQKPNWETLSRLKSEIKEFGIDAEQYPEAGLLLTKLEAFEKTVQRLQSRLLPDHRMEIEISEKDYKSFAEYVDQLCKGHRELLVHRITEEELGKIEEEVVGLEFEWGDLSRVVAEERRKLEEWISEYRGFKVFKGQDLERMLNKTDDLITQSPEMLELLELFGEFKHWNHEYERLLARFSEEKAPISFSEIRDFLEKPNKRLDFEENDETLRTRLREYEELNARLKGLLSKPMEITVWLKVKKDYGPVMASCEMEEGKEFEEKMRVYKEISQSLSQKKFSISRLREYQEKAESSHLDEKLIKEISGKLSKASSLKAEIEELTNKKEFEFSDSEKIANLLLEIKGNRFDFDEISLLKALLDSFDDIEKLYKLWIQYQSDPQERESIEAARSKSFKELIAKLCDSERLKEILPVIYAELKPLIAKLSKAQILDENLQNLKAIYQEFLLNHDAERLLASEHQTGPINGELLEGFYREARHIEKKSDLLLKVESLHTRYSSIREKLESSLNSLESMFLSESAESTKLIQSQVEDIEKELQECGFSLEEPAKRAKLIRAWLDWLLKGQELMRLLEEKREVDFENSMRLLNLGQKLEFPAQNKVFSELQVLFDTAAKFKERSAVYAAEKRKYQEGLKTAKAENAMRKRLFELNRLKPSFQSVQSLYDSIQVEAQTTQNLTVLLRSELLELEADINSTLDFIRRCDSFRLTHKIDSITELKSLKPNDFEVIKTQVSNFRQESFNTIWLYHKEWDLEFSRFEMKFHGFSILAGLQPVTLVFLKNYLKFAEDSKDEEILKEVFMKELSEIHSKTRELNQRIEELKNLQEELSEDSGGFDRRSFISEETLEEMLEMARSSVVNLGENKAFLENVASKYRKAKEFYEKNQLNNPQSRIVHLEFTRFFEEIKLLPVRFEDFQFIQGQVRKYDVLQRYLEKSRKYLNMEQVPVKIAEALMQRYSESRILINDYEKLHEKFARSSQLMEELEKKIALFDDFLPQSFEEYQQLSSKFENIAIDFGERTLEVRVLLFKQKVHFIEETREKAKGSAGKSILTKVSFKQLKHDLQYGYSLLLTSENVEKLRNEIKVLEGLLLEIQDKFAEIEEIKLATVLEDYNPIFLGFIDLSEELIEYKMSLTYEKDAKMNVDLGIKPFYSEFKEGCDCLRLMKFLNITPCNRGFIDPAEITRIFAEETILDPSLARDSKKPVRNFAFLKEQVGGSKEKKTGVDQFKLKDKNGNRQGEFASDHQKSKLKSDKAALKSKEKQQISNPKANDQIDRALGKRKVNPTSFGSEFITGFLNEEEGDPNDKPSKKLKKEINSNIVQKPSMLKPLGLKDPIQKEAPKEGKSTTLVKIVPSEKREDLMNKLDRLVKANPKFKKTNKNLKSFLQILENNIFGSFHSNPSKYDAEAQNLSRLFEKLLKFPYISANILAKNFRVETIQNLNKNIEKLLQIENNLKSKELEREQKSQETNNAPLVKKPQVPASKPVITHTTNPPPTKKPEPALVKKTKTEQYDPFEKSVPKKSPMPSPHVQKEDPLKDLFSSILEKPKQPNPSQKPSSLLSLTESSRGSKNIESISLEKQSKNPVSRQKHSILENYEALSSDEEKHKKTPKTEPSSTKKEEKKLEFSDDESNLSLEKLSAPKKRYSLDNSEDSFDAQSKSSISHSHIYDPMTEVKKPEIEQPILFDPDNEEGPNNDEKYQIYTQKFAPKGSILRIYDGRVRFNSTIAVHANFLTIEEIGVVRENFPKISVREKGTSLKLAGTTDYMQFSDFYFGSSGVKNKRILLVGWVQPSQEKYLKPIEAFAEELYHSNKIGGYKFGKANSASIHFFSLKQLVSDNNLRNFEFKIRSKDPNEKPALIFFLTTKQKTSEPSIEPEILDLFESSKSNEIIDLNKKTEIFEKPEDLQSPLTNEEKSPEEVAQNPEMKPVAEKNDEDIEEIIKKMETTKPEPFFEEKASNLGKSIFEQANIQAEELTPVREGEDEEKVDEGLDSKNNAQENDFNAIIEELQKMNPGELKEFVASFEPDSRGKIANFLKDISKDESFNMTKPETIEPTVNPVQTQNPTGNVQMGFYNPMIQQQQPQQPQSHSYFPQTPQNMGYMGAGGFSRQGKMYGPGNNMRQGGFNRFGGPKPVCGHYKLSQMEPRQYGGGYMMGGQMNMGGFQGGILPQMGQGQLGMNLGQQQQNKPTDKQRDTGNN